MSTRSPSLKDTRELSDGIPESEASEPVRASWFRGTFFQVSSKSSFGDEDVKFVCAKLDMVLSSQAIVVGVCSFLSPGMWNGMKYASFLKLSMPKLKAAENLITIVLSRLSAQPAQAELNLPTS